MTIAQVRLWGAIIGGVRWDDEEGVAFFEYDRDFIHSGREIAPLMMPLSDQVYEFRDIPRETFHGLPGLLADSLPDKFGNAVIEAWLAGQGRSLDDFNPVERLCYTGVRGMGALEFLPALGPEHTQSEAVDFDALVGLASEILSKRDALKGSFSSPDRHKALQDLLSIGTSAGGARAKAVIAWNPDTNEVRSGQTEVAEGFSHWLLKFDGVTGNKDRELDDPEGYGLAEYAYHRIALAAGIRMSECRILRENGRSHFMTRRFDRTDEGGKIHMQSLCALGHYDFKQAQAYSYEQALHVIRQLELPKATLEEQFRRMTFNIIARNQDDHVKNIAFLMDRSGQWSLAPAFDVVYSYNPAGRWTAAHQMSMNGKRDGFTLEDFDACARNFAFKRGRAAEIAEEVLQAVLRWEEIAEETGVPGEMIRKIGSVHRTDIH